MWSSVTITSKRHRAIDPEKELRKRKIQNHRMWYLSHETVLLVFFRAVIYIDILLLQLFYIFTTSCTSEIWMFSWLRSAIAFPQVRGLPNPDQFPSWATAEMGISDMLGGRGSRRLEADLLPFEDRMLGWGHDTPPGPNERDVVATSCKAAFESQVLSPGFLVFQAWGTLLSCLLFHHLWNLLQKNLQWYDIADNNYSLSQGSPFLCFYSGNGDIRRIFLYINRRLVCWVSKYWSNFLFWLSNIFSHWIGLFLIFQHSGSESEDSPQPSK